MQLPANIGKYQLEEFLGGGMSHVYRARDTVIGRTVAVKVLTEAGCEDAEVRARFLAEARMAGNLTHDNVLHIYDFGEYAPGRPYMVMEFLRGEDLRHAIRDGHTGELKDKLRIALQVARALGYIHSQKIIHRDIKPENVHINEAGVVKLMDFGIAKTEGMAMTRAGYVLGTPYYMAPEQVTGQNITEQVDVYAFGVLLFELLTGMKPISGDTVERIFYSILNEPLNLEPLHRAGAPEAVCRLVAGCTAKQPGARPQGFAPVCEELERIAGELDAPTVMLPAKEPVPMPPRPRPVWILPVILAAVVALAVGLYFALRPKPVVVVPAKNELVLQKNEPSLPATIMTDTGEMVLVPEGSYLSGEKKEESSSLPAFYIDKTEVTNAAYLAFCNATKRDLPKVFAQNGPEYPVVNVSILDAQAFATWAGKKLPNAQQWEKAARGTDGRLFPWGNEKDPLRANVATKGLRPATDFANGASPYGALNMVGNAWELVNELMTPSEQAVKFYRGQMRPPPEANEPWYMSRGQSFTEKTLEDGAVWDSATIPSRWKNPYTGFRCVKVAH